jgi:hypothetical protein
MGCRKRKVKVNGNFMFWHEVLEQLKMGYGKREVKVNGNFIVLARGADRV